MLSTLGYGLISNAPRTFYDGSTAPMRMFIPG
jgi:hypothetical protein